MRIAILAAALFMLAAPAGAQTEMDRAESELRDSMAAAPGVAVERVSPDELRIRMPSDITFDFDRADVKRQFMPRVHDLARTLNSYPSLSVAIIGHADALGSDDYNLELSERRARTVGAALMNDGVAYRRIAASGRGEWEPIASNANDWGRAQNRRVEIRLNSKPK
jgi:outer membrane protein OmpA-like peptidoglycan-associated protein